MCNFPGPFTREKKWHTVQLGWNVNVTPARSVYKRWREPTSSQVHHQENRMGEVFVGEGGGWGVGYDSN